MMSDLLYQALASPLGIELRTDDTARAIARFYSERTRCADPDLASLQCRRVASDASLLWIVKSLPKESTS